MTDSALLTAALSYAARGWSVVPAHHPTGDGCSCGKPGCASPGKHPRIQWGAYQRRRATADELRTWWGRWPRSNIAVVTGEISGLAVLDVDPRHGGDDALAGLGPLPPTVTALTGGGGMHLYYQHPGHTVGSFANAVNGLDRRADGGLVIAPPSSHSSGHGYEWEIGYGPDDMALAPLPAVVEALSSAAGEQGSDLRRGPIDAETLLRTGIPEGARNDTLTRLAGSLAANDPTWAAVMPAVDFVNRRACHPPLADAEVEKIVRSIIEREQGKRADAAANDASIAGNGPDLSGLPDDERLRRARELWSRFGIICSDWYVLMSAEPEYILVTPEREVAFGDDLLSPLMVRRKALTHLDVLIPRMKAARWEPLAAQMRHLAREELVVDSRAAETIAEWVEEYARAYKAQEWEPGRRRDALSGGPILYAGVLAFRLAHFQRYVEGTYGEKLLPRQMASLLKRAGAQRDKIKVTAEGDQARVWTVKNIDTYPFS